MVSASDKPKEIQRSKTGPTLRKPLLQVSRAAVHDQGEFSTSETKACFRCIAAFYMSKATGRFGSFLPLRSLNAYVRFRRIAPNSPLTKPAAIRITSQSPLTQNPDSASPPSPATPTSPPAFSPPGSSPPARSAISRTPPAAPPPALPSSAVPPATARR